MLLLLSGASGVGKSTARRGVTRVLGAGVEAVELVHFGPPPPVQTRAWRQETVEAAVRRAIELDAQGRHLLLAGDPVPAGEVLAVPSAAGIDIAVCLLDADPASQAARLRGRGEPEELLVHHVAFADWLRVHATDPSHVPEVVTTNSWTAMQWHRWVGLGPGDPRWAMSVIDTSHRGPEAVAEDVAHWCQKALNGSAPVFRAGWWQRPNPSPTSSR